MKEKSSLSCQDHNKLPYQEPRVPRNAALIHSNPHCGLIVELSMWTDKVLTVYLSKYNCVLWGWGCGHEKCTISGLQMEFLSYTKQLQHLRPWPSRWGKTVTQLIQLFFFFCSNTCWAVFLWLRYQFLTSAGEAFDMKVSLLNSNHLPFACFPTSLASDWFRTPLSVCWTLVISYKTHKTHILYI